MMRIVFAIAILMASFCESTLWADSYIPFANFRQVDVTGRYYVVVTRGPGAPRDPGRGTPVTYKIVERGPGTPPVADVEDFWEWLSDSVVPNPEVAVRPGDLVLGNGKLKRSPRLLLISSSGHGFVGLDVRGYNYGDLRSGDAVVIVTRRGAVLHRKHLVDLFTEEEVGKFGGTAGGVSWAGGGWINERRREVVVVSSRPEVPKSSPRLLRIVDLKTGHVRKGSTQDVVLALAEGNRAAYELAIDMAAEMNLRDAIPSLERILADLELPLKARLQCAVTLGAFGNHSGVPLLTSAALVSGPDQDYAIELLPDLIGDAAAKTICDAMRVPAPECGRAAWSAMTKISCEVAVPELVCLLDENGSVPSVTFAMDSLGSQGPGAKVAVPSLMGVLRNDARIVGYWSTTHEHAANALGDIGPAAKEALPLLMKCAELYAKETVGGEKRYFPNDFTEAIKKIRD